MKKTVILLSLLLSQSLWSEELSLHDAIAQTLQTHPNIKQFILQKKTAEAGVELAKADYLPQLSLRGEYDLVKTYTLPNQNGFATVDDIGWQTSLTLRQKLWDFSKTEALVEVAKSQEEIAKLSLEESKALLAYQVSLQYELILLQKEALRVAQEDVHAKEEIYAQSQALFHQGLKTKADGSRIHASLLAAKEGEMIALAGYKKALLSLSSSMGRSLIEPLVLLDGMISDSATTPSVEEVISNSPRLRELKQEIKKSESLYHATQGINYGSIDLVGSYTYQETLDTYDAKLLGVSYSVPLYTGGHNQALIEQSKINQDRAKVSYEKEVLALREEVGKLLLDLMSYQQSIEAKEAQIVSAKATQEVMDARYRNGLANYIEVLDASKTLLDAKLGLLKTIYAKSSTLHRLSYLKGEIL